MCLSSCPVEKIAKSSNNFFLNKQNWEEISKGSFSVWTNWDWSPAACWPSRRHWLPYRGFPKHCSNLVCGAREAQVHPGIGFSKRRNKKYSPFLLVIILLSIETKIFSFSLFIFIFFYYLFLLYFLFFPFFLHWYVNLIQGYLGRNRWVHKQVRFECPETRAGGSAAVASHFWANDGGVCLSFSHLHRAWIQVGKPLPR